MGYSGYFKNNLQHGWGIYHNSNSNITYNGLWYNGYPCSLGISYNYRISYEIEEEEEEGQESSNGNKKNVYQGLRYNNGNKYGPGYNFIFHNSKQHSNNERKEEDSSCKKKYSSQTISSSQCDYDIIFEIWDCSNATTNTINDDDDDDESRIFESLLSSTTTTAAANISSNLLLYY